MLLYRRFLLSLLASSFFAPLLHAADKTQLAARLKSAAEYASLDSSGLRPWHLALDITLYDTDGKNPKPATVEIWAADTNMKMVESVAGLQVTTLRNNDKLLRTAAQAAEFTSLESLVEEILHPIPDELLQPTVNLSEDKPTFAKIPMECIEPSFPHTSSATISIDRPLSFCFINGKDSLAISFGGGKIEFRQQTAMFQSKEVPVHSQVLVGKTLRADAKITKLETFTPAPDTFAPTSDMKPFDGPIVGKSADFLDLGLVHMPPVYPMTAREQHVSGSVNFDAIIGADGHIASLNQTGHADSTLTAAAETAVRQWIYRPFLVCGIPVPVKTVITVNFNLSP